MDIFLFDSFFFLLQDNPRNLDPSSKTVLDILNCYRREIYLIAELIQSAYIFGVILEKEKPDIIDIYLFFFCKNHAIVCMYSVLCKQTKICLYVSIVYFIKANTSIIMQGF